MRRVSLFVSLSGLDGLTEPVQHLLTPGLVVLLVEQLAPPVSCLLHSSLLQSQLVS